MPKAEQRVLDKRAETLARLRAVMGRKVVTLADARRLYPDLVRINESV